MVIGRFAEYHSRRGTRVVEPVEYGGIDGLEEVGEIRDIGCGNDETQRIEKDEEDYCFMTYLSGNWYKEQAGFIKKLKKIWAIIRNKDFYYSEIILNKKDWEEYKKWINEK